MQGWKEKDNLAKIIYGKRVVLQCGLQSAISEIAICIQKVLKCDPQGTKI